MEKEVGGMEIEGDHLLDEAVTFREIRYNKAGIVNSSMDSF